MKLYLTSIRVKATSAGLSEPAPHTQEQKNLPHFNPNVLFQCLTMWVFTSGGRILQMPVFSAMGRILLMNPKGSEKSSQLGSNTGHSGGGTNSANADMVVMLVWNKSLKMIKMQRVELQQFMIISSDCRLVKLPPCPSWWSFKCCSITSQTDHHSHDGAS